jgi:hypothetical protein
MIVLGLLPLVIASLSKELPQRLFMSHDRAHDMQPLSSGHTLRQEMKENNITPYGVIGVLITTSTLLALGPLQPRLGKLNRTLRVTLAIFDCIITFSFMIISAFRCRDKWELVVLGLCKSTSPAILAKINLHYTLINGSRQNKVHEGMLGLIMTVHAITFPFSMVALGILIYEAWEFKLIRFSTYLFFIVVAIPWLGILFLAYYVWDVTTNPPDDPGALGFVPICGGSLILVSWFVVSLYTNFALGAIAGNMGGIPDHDSFIFWVSFVVKILSVCFL